MELVLPPSALEKVSKYLMNTLEAEFTLIKNAPNELEKLKRFKTVIANVQQDVAGQDLSQQHADWLDEMMDAAYDIEDIIDMSSTEILRRRSNNNGNSTGYTRRVIDFVSYTNNPLIFRHKIGTSVQKTFDRLATIAKERGYHLTLGGRDGVENLRTETFSHMGGDVVLGRNHDLKIILEQLLFNEKTSIEVLVLVGMGGVGKTTLAKLVYNNSQVDALFRKRKLWVCVSQIFDLSKICKHVIEQIDKKPCQLKGLQALIEKLKELIEKNMYLLVLDDVWTNSSLTEDVWSNMKSLFHSCKILVTTREENVKFVILPEPYMHRVGCLPEDASWSLFKNVAFPNGNVLEELKDISKSIVKKCKGVPLAMRVLGSIMRKKQDCSYWKGIEENNILDPNIEGENRIFSILKFSYHNLPLKSKFCFVYCSIFPKDSVMKKIVLIQQWAGNGFISLNEGNEIFDDLLSRCFFQDVEKDVYGSITTFKMHDLIHDLAESIAKSLQCGIFDDSIQDKKQVRYLSILNMRNEISYSDFSSILKDARVLRTLQLLSSNRVSKSTFLDNCFTKFKFLRVLVCSYQYDFEEIPSSIDNLKLLRYVDFCHTGITRLPETVCNLQNLQTLKLNNCQDLIVLPKKLGKLSELRYLENAYCHRLDSMPDGMDRLSLLQTLNTFVVNDGEKNLNELRHLDHLEGSLRIRNLNKIQNIVLENGILNRKSNLVSLTLGFFGCSTRSEGRDTEKVLKALQPHPNLKSLNIIRFDGFCIPLDMSCLQSLIHLKIINCKNLTTLPKDMCSLQSLTHLHISRCENLTCLPNNMCRLKSLTSLTIKSCPSLVDVSFSLKYLTSLKEIEVNDCNQWIRNWSDDAISRICSVEKRSWISICSKDDDIDLLSKWLQKKIDSTKILQTLTINGGHGNRNFDNEKHRLNICCFEQEKLPEELVHVQDLKIMYIENCPNLSCLPDGMKKPQFLKIERCPMLENYCKERLYKDD
ncbi:NB-ARC domain-containing disease resistance protein [Zostera marina]|uniref:NB-ARC domain-containing disease resistance protein n=1 Tax=Zostera marina TaxID=29655 RepID=A0A0K9NL49_ZOSMR|nr:NB-ARC domain-containing disease resistance protein [Zostera marina]